MDSQSSIKVLLVEDDPSILGLMVEYIFSLGCTADVAVDGKTAIEKLATDSFSIVITDIVMPNVDGLELLEYIKVQYPHIEVIVITGHVEQYPPQAVRDAGAFEYLAKPFTYEDLLDVMERAIQKYQSNII